MCDIIKNSNWPIIIIIIIFWFMHSHLTDITFLTSQIKFWLMLWFMNSTVTYTPDIIAKCANQSGCRIP